VAKKKRKVGRKMAEEHVGEELEEDEEGIGMFQAQMNQVLKNLCDSESKNKDSKKKVK